MPHKNEDAHRSSYHDSVARDEALRNLPIDEDLEEGLISGPPLQSRRDSRELVLKIIYAHEISNNSMREIMLEFLEDRSDKYGRFAGELCDKIETGSEQIDTLIVKHSEKWDFNRIAILDKLILRIAIAEILFFPDIPPKVTINEAIEIAKRYSTINSSRFVNGILDAVYNDLKDDLKKTNVKIKNDRNKSQNVKE